MLTLTCKRAAALLSLSMDRRLQPHERLRLRLHLFVCAACTRCKRQLTLLRHIIRQRARRLEAKDEHDAPRLSLNARARLLDVVRHRRQLASIKTADDTEVKQR